MNEYRGGFKQASSDFRWSLPRVFGIIVLLILLFTGVKVVGTAIGWFGEAAEVASEEFGPRALLEKYEWFKNVSAQLDKKVADISVFRSRVDLMKETYGSRPRYEWDRTDREQLNLWSQELAGVIASYNGLSAQYNAQMAKFNWRFANKGMLPKGATEPLPREYKPYIGG